MPTPIAYMGSSVKNSTRLKAAEVLARVPGANTITHVWGYDPNPRNTEHHTGLAADFMVSQNKALGDAVYTYLWINRERLGVKHIIWQQHIISTVTDPGIRRKMADRGSPTENHMDHVHVMFFDKAYVKPTVVRKPIVKPGKTVKVTTILRKGMTGNAVRSLQKGLNRVFPAYSRLAVDGAFGNNTERVVKEFQERSGLVPDGEVGPKTRAKLNAVGVNF